MTTSNFVVPPCPLALTDVQQYIRSKGPADIVGTQGNPANTLLAEVWYFTHGLAHMACVTPGGFLEVGSSRYELSEELWAVHLLFERLMQWHDHRVNKTTWVTFAREHWPKALMTIGKMNR